MFQGLCFGKAISIHRYIDHAFEVLGYYFSFSHLFFLSNWRQNSLKITEYISDLRHIMVGEGLKNRIDKDTNKAIRNEGEE